MRRQVTKPRHEEEELSSLPERKMTLRMMQEGRVRYKEWKVHAQVGEKVQEVQKPWRQEELEKQRQLCLRWVVRPSRDRLCHSKPTLGSRGLVG